MNKQTINIYSDKRFAAIFFFGLFSASVYFIISIWFDSNSLLIKLIVSFTGLLFAAISSFGIFFSLVSKQFRYYGPGTTEYNKNRSDEQITFLTFDDRLQARINPKKIVYYKDITSITAIPNAFSYYDMMDDVLFNYTEIKYDADKKIILTYEYDFLKAFQQNQNTTVRELPSANEVEEKFGKAKFIATSFLFQASPIRINLWTKQ